MVRFGWLEADAKEAVAKEAVAKEAVAKEAAAKEAVAKDAVLRHDKFFGQSRAGGLLAACEHHQQGARVLP